jgi:AAA lid domain
VVVIVAGYPDKMSAFLGSNPGLPSRFKRTIAFPDYGDAELLLIFRKFCADNEYELTNEANDAVASMIGGVPRQANFGNGRLVRQMFEDTLERQAARIVREDAASADDLRRILPSDLMAPPGDQFADV